MKYGIDVSMFVKVDIMKYKPDFCIIRIGEGGYQDGLAAEYVNTCIKNKVPFGYYFVLRLNNGLTVKDNIKNATERILDLGRPSMGIWCDVETADAYKEDAINQFCAAMEELGLYAGIMDFRTGKIKAPKYDKWVAYHGRDTGNIKDFGADEIQIIKNIGTMWQYKGSSSGPDLNVSFLDDLSVYAGKKEEKPEKVDHDPAFDQIIKQLDAIPSKITSARKLLAELKEAVKNDN